VRILAVSLLVFVAMSGVVGSIPMLMSPGGEPWGMPQSLLQHSPFHSYLVPGIVLLVANGLVCAWVLRLTLRSRSGYGWWIVLQGAVLLGWLIVECAMLKLVAWPHYIYGTVALLLVASGIALAHPAKTARLR
jgi:hypothetical protein